MEDRCVVCGKTIPEGRLVCVDCEEKAKPVKAKPLSKEEKLKRLNNIVFKEQEEFETKISDAIKKYYLPVWKLKLPEDGLLPKDEDSQTAKADSGKPILSLVPKEIIYEIEKVRQFGVAKYKEPDNWKKVELERYHQALLRHTLAVWNDITARDKESGLLHLSHIATNVAFMLELMKDKE